MKKCNLVCIMGRHALKGTNIQLLRIFPGNTTLARVIFMGAIFHEKCERFSKQFVFRNVMVKVLGCRSQMTSYMYVP